MHSSLEFYEPCFWQGLVLKVLRQGPVVGCTSACQSKLGHVGNLAKNKGATDHVQKQALPVNYRFRMSTMTGCTTVQQGCMAGNKHGNVDVVGFSRGSLASADAR